ncbi:hypothetical protein FIBSPDRAFT_840622 [Athelia psychrophila]|uniref:Metallo-hydrolase/oxidoreductase n=1 Tax=Athelia psychrophila TaxID=1759441 RepID=A0A165X1T7_9AGAM|nr:hypothetical protein FIBSPDRAFT_840622 [Fibularhizoctonia sp. CBS 109695]
MSANIDELVIREVTPGIWTFSKPFVRFHFFPWGGRSTAIRLATGDVWVLASTPLTINTKETIDKLGPVKWIMAGDIVHYMYLAEYKAAYPDAKVIGVKDLVPKMKEKGLELDGAYGADPEGTKYGFEDEIDSCYFSGFGNKDVAWLHKPSKTLVEADLLFNLPGTEQYSLTKTSPKVPLIGGIDPFGTFHKHFVYGQGKDMKAMVRDAKTVASWDFERVIPCHGDVIEGRGKEAWVAAFSKYLSK